jgi:TonB family protein
MMRKPDRVSRMDKRAAREASPKRKHRPRRLIERLESWRPIRGSRRWVIGAIVVLLHFVVIEVLLAERVESFVAAEESRVAVYFVTDRLSAAQVIPPIPQNRPAVKPHVARKGVPARELSDEPLGVMALTIPKSEKPAPQQLLDPSIPEAEPEDIHIVRMLCDAAYPIESKLQQEQGAVTLVIRVQPDGRVSQTKVEVSSGVPRLDEAAAYCLAQGRFVPELLAELPTESWQRTHWVFSVTN